MYAIVSTYDEAGWTLLAKYRERLQAIQARYPNEESKEYKDEKAKLESWREEEIHRFDLAYAEITAKYRETFVGCTKLCDCGCQPKPEDIELITAPIIIEPPKLPAPPAAASGVSQTAPVIGSSATIKVAR